MACCYPTSICSSKKQWNQFPAIIITLLPYLARDSKWGKNFTFLFCIEDGMQAKPYVLIINKADP